MESNVLSIMIFIILMGIISISVRMMVAIFFVNQIADQVIIPFTAENVFYAMCLYIAVTFKVDLAFKMRG